MQAALDEYQSGTDPLMKWLDESIIDNPTGKIPKRGLIESYKRACEAAKRIPLTDTAFGKALKRARPHVSDCRVTLHGKTYEAYGGVAWVLQEGVN